MYHLSNYLELFIKWENKTEEKYGSMFDMSGTGNESFMNELCERELNELNAKILRDHNERTE